MCEEFNPQEWLDKAKADQSIPSANADIQSFSSSVSSPSVPSASADKHSFSPSSDIASEVDQVVARIEAAFEDITTSYTDWVNVGFAFANEFGEAGRKNFHRVSRFYVGYTKAETDQQYDRCLKSNKGGITIKTFFHLAKQAGVEVGRMENGEGKRENGDGKRENGEGIMENGERKMEYRSPLPVSGLLSPDSVLPSPDSDDDPPPEDPEQPTLPDNLFTQLPDFFKRVVERASSKEERDILLLGAMVALGSCLTSFSGIYDEITVFPNLFLYVTAKASSGKGRLILCRSLVNLIHQDKRKQFYQENLQYEVEMKEYNALKGKDLGLEKPKKPPVRMLFIPANNSSSGFLQLISDNDGEGLILETEGDTLAQALKTDYGNFSDILRKAFHQEFISYYRKTDHEHGEIERPRFAMILSSTFGQLKNLIPSTENGLASRFMFYNMNLKPVWKDVFVRSNEISLKEHFEGLGQEFYSLYNTLQSKAPIQFRLTNEQQDAFNTFFSQMQDKYLVLKGLDYLAIIRRLGLIAFRLMMILTAMRIPETGDFSVKQQCREEDFESALAIIKVLVRHASHVVSQLPEEIQTEKRGNKKEQFFEGLGKTFTHKDFIGLAKSLNIAERTAVRYIAVFCEKGFIRRDQLNCYTNLHFVPAGNDQKATEQEDS